MLKIMHLRLLKQDLCCKVSRLCNCKIAKLRSSHARVFSVNANDSCITTNCTSGQVDQAITAALMALMLTGATTIAHNKNTANRNIACCDAKSQTATQWNTPEAVSRKDSKPKIGQPRNVMLHRMRSARARNLQEKYDIAWDTKLGEGAYGSVYPGRLSATGEKIALKEIAKRYTNRSAFRNETDALLRIWDNGGHPNISGLRDMYEDHSHYYLILDLVSGGEMFQHLIAYGAYSEADAARLMREVASALAFLHGIGIVHADLKPENLLLCSKMVSNGTIKIIDFGCASVAKSSHQQEEEAHSTSAGFDPNDEREDDGDQSVGTTAYWPPERFLPGAAATPAMDMWSTGVILYIMLTGVHPFDPHGNSSDAEIEKRLLENPAPPMGEFTAHLSPSAIDLVKKLMHRDPEKRLNAYSMMRHPWICGETARTEKMEGSAEKLSKFKEMREGIESAIFAALVESSGDGDKINEALVMPRGNTKKSDMHIMKKAFAIFDQAGKGYVTSDDLGRVVSKVTGKVVSSADSKEMLAAASDAGFDEEFSPGLSLAVFSDLFGNFKYVHFPKGEMIFNAGDDADAMYFITSGKVELLTRKGQLISILRHGDFFGERGLLESGSKCFTGAKAVTPVDAIKITKKDFIRYAKASSTKGIQQSLKLKHKINLLRNAKSLIRLQTNLTTRILEKGEVVYAEGDVGDSMFHVDEYDGGELDVYHDNVKVHEYKAGETFGESSLLLKRPRS